MPPSPDSRGLGLRSSFLSRPPLGSRALRPGDSLTIPRMALSVSFIHFVSSADATDATELLTPTLVGLTPTEHVSLRWTHYCPKWSTAIDSGRLSRMCPLHLILWTLVRWIAGEQQQVLEYPTAGNLVLNAQLRGQCVHPSDAERQLARLSARLDRRTLTEVATIVRPDTIMRWHRQLIARKRTYAKHRPGRPPVHAEIRGLVVRMATETPRWGYTRIQGALKNLGHCVARTTVANILKQQGILPSGKRPMSWRTFLRAHLYATLVGADRFTSAMSTLCSWLTCRAVYVIVLCSHRVHRMASPLHPHEQAVPHLADVVGPALVGSRMRICARHRSWSTAISAPAARTRGCGSSAPVVSPNREAQSRLASSSQEEYVNRVVPIGEGHDRPTLTPFVTPHHRARNHPVLGHELL